MDIVRQARCNQHTDLRYGYLLHLYLEILSFVHDDTTNAFLGNVKRLGSVGVAHFAFFEEEKLSAYVELPELYRQELAQSVLL